MEEGREVSSDRFHESCHNPCTICHNKGYLENEEICPVCAGTGCKDKNACEPAGGLDCDH